MENAVGLAIVAGVFALPTTVAPIIVMLIQNRNTRKVAEALNKRQDEVSAKTTEVARVLASSTAVTDKKLNNITSMVDGGYTEALKSDLDGREAALALTLELVDTRRKLNQEPSALVLTSIEVMRDRIEKLQANIAARLAVVDKLNVSA